MVGSTVTVPPGVCDTHMHFYDGRYPTATRATLFPSDATPADYEAVRVGLSTLR